MAKRSIGEKTEGIWQIQHGRVRTKQRTNRPRRVEDLQYNNPYRYKTERVWFDGCVVFATEQGEVEVDPKKVKVAQEYQVVYAVKLTPKGKLARGAEPKRVPGQFNIYDSVPGMKKYSAIWQFNYVIAPKDYVPNTLRSESDCLRSGYVIRKSIVFETLLTDRCFDGPRSRAADLERLHVERLTDPRGARNTLGIYWNRVRNLAAGSMRIARHVPSRSRCLSPETITSTPPSAAASKTRSSDGSAEISLTVSVGRTT